LYPPRNSNIAPSNVIPEAKGYTVVVPDLVKGELRMIRLGM
jgi:hypothetical protein